MNDVASPVTENLKLDVARLLDVLLDEKCRIAERLHRLALRGLDGRTRLFLRTNALHAFAAAACRCLHENGKADALRFATERLQRLIGAVVSRNDGNAESVHETARFGLRSHRGD